MESLSFLAVFALIIHLNKSSVSNYNRLGFLILVLGILFGLHWIFNSLHNIGGLPLYFSIPATLLLAIYVASFYAAALFIAKKYKFTPVEVAAIVTLFEWTKSFLFTGFPWIEIGTLSLNTPLVNYAPIFGTYAVTFVATLLIFYIVNKQNVRSIIKRPLFEPIFTDSVQSKKSFGSNKPLPEKKVFTLIDGLTKDSAGRRGAHTISFVFDKDSKITLDDVKGELEKLNKEININYKEGKDENVSFEERRNNYDRLYRNYFFNTKFKPNATKYILKYIDDYVKKHNNLLL